MRHNALFRLGRRVLGVLTAVSTVAACASTGGHVAKESPGDDEVRVGYDSQDRAEITGSVGSITAADIAGQKVTSVEEMIQGRFAGVQVVRSRDGGFSLRIRGVSTFMGNSEPLIVIDGMPMHNGPGRALFGLNPADVARIDILKDAGATAIYGSRGANGVVLITTKRAK